MLVKPGSGARLTPDQQIKGRVCVMVFFDSPTGDAQKGRRPLTGVCGGRTEASAHTLSECN